MHATRSISLLVLAVAFASWPAAGQSASAGAAIADDVHRFPASPGPPVLD